MGNIPSQEAPRRPQKLTKPQLGLQLPVPGFTDPAIDSPSCHGRSSSSYLVGSVPISPINLSPTDPNGPNSGITIAGDEIDNRVTSANHRPAHRDSRRGSNVSRTCSFRSEHSPRSYSMIASNSRPYSFPIEGRRPLTRSESHCTTRRRASFNHDVKSYEIQRLMSLDQSILNNYTMDALEIESSVGDVTESTWKRSHPTQNTSSPVERANSERTNSDLSMCPPVRRRSIIQTPGVATRSQRSDTSSSYTYSFPSTISTTPEETRRNSIESAKDDNLVPLSYSYSSQPYERVVTPCEAEYKQLGGMKFGSLRIINGSPQPSPLAENDARGSKLQTDRAYFDRELSPSTVVAVSTKAELVPSSPSEAFQTAPKTTVEVDLSRLSPLFERPEALHVRDDPSAKRTPKEIVVDLESKMLRSLNRSDSGFVSSPSSEASRRTASKTDSGYSSNVSLRSLRSLRSAVTDMSRKPSERQSDQGPESSALAKPDSGAASDVRNILSRSGFAPRQPQKVPDSKPATSEDITSAKTPSYLSLTSITRGRLRMPSLRSSKSTENPSPRPRSQSSPPRTQAGVVHDVSHLRASHPAPEADNEGSSSNGAKLQRNSNGSQRRGPPKVRDNRAKDRNVSRPMRVTNTTASNAIKEPNRPWLRDEKSEDTLRTILSVGSTDMLGRQGSSNAKDDSANVSKESLAAQTPRRKSLRRSLTQAATALFSLDKSPSAKSSKDTDFKSSSDAKVENHNVDPVRPIPAQRSTSASAVRSIPTRNKVHRTESAPQSPTRRTMAAAARSNTTASGAQRSSLPMTSHPTRTLKTPPPVSMRTRSGTRVPQGRKKPEGSRSPPPAETPAARRRSAPRGIRREQVHSYPPAQTPMAAYGMSLNGVMSMTPQQIAAFQGYQMTPVQTVSGPYHTAMHSAQAGHRRTRSMPIQSSHMQPTGIHPMHTQLQYNQHHQVQHLNSNFTQQFSPQPVQGIDPMSYQQFNLQASHNTLQSPQQNRRVSSQGALYNGHAPPYRVLHSYNSPAYRGAPIWG